MKSFLKRAFYFATIVIFISALTRWLTPPDLFWGNNEYMNKLQLMKKETYNTIFFGSSRILTGINPLVFDSLINQHKAIKVKSFNMATPGTWANETFYLYNHFLEDSSLSNSVNLVFMEFQNIMAIRPDKLASDKAVYYQSFENLKFAYRYSMSEIGLSLGNIPSSLYITFSYSLAGFQNLLNFSRLNINDTPIDSLSYYGINSRGYLGLHEKNAPRKKISTKELEAYKKSIQKHLQKPTNIYNKEFYEKCIEEIHQAESRGIRLIFVLPPVKLTSGMVSVFNLLPQKNKIEVCNPDKFPELFLEENWIDETHLSIKGGKYLSEKIINEINQSEY